MVTPTPDAVVPVLILDVDEHEADKILLTHDPLAGMATVSEDRLRELLSEVRTENAAVRGLLDSIAAETGDPVPAGGLPSPSQSPEVIVPESYQVVVECRDEADQQTVFEKMRAEGYRCRVLTL